MQKASTKLALPGRLRGVAGRKSAEGAITSAIRTLDLECEGLAQLSAEVQGPMAPAFADAVQRLAAATGRVIVTGIGKSGHVGQKIAATFASTGTPAFFLHPSEASHGDLGMVTRDDLIVALSWSGETVELKPVITYSRRFAVPLVAITSRPDSALGQQSDVVLTLPRVKEACPHGLAPTTSTTMQLALGDALAIALLEARGFTAQDFKIFHPGGSLGASLAYVTDVMHAGDQLPIIRNGRGMPEALATMSEKGLGCVGVIDAKGRLIGVITDGDLRRKMSSNMLEATVDDVMTKRPKTVAANTLTSAALELINASRITALFVVEKGKPVGLIHVHDLLRLGVA